MSTVGKLQAKLAELLQINEAMVTHIESIAAERDYFKNGMAELQDIIDKLEPERDALVVKAAKLEKKIAAINDGIAEYKAMANDATADLVRKALMDVREEIIQRDLYQSAPDFIEKFANEYAERVKRGEQ